MTVPTTADSMRVMKPIVSEILEPITTLLKMSLPRWSVPKRWALDGGRNLSERWISSGSLVAM
jgi:hypothetical protein